MLLFHLPPAQLQLSEQHTFAERLLIRLCCAVCVTRPENNRTKLCLGLVVEATTEEIILKAKSHFAKCLNWFPSVSFDCQGHFHFLILKGFNWKSK